MELPADVVGDLDVAFSQAGGASKWSLKDHSRRIVKRQISEGDTRRRVYVFGDRGKLDADGRVGVWLARPPIGSAQILSLRALTAVFFSPLHPSKF